MRAVAKLCGARAIVGVKSLKIGRRGQSLLNRVSVCQSVGAVAKLCGCGEVAKPAWAWRFKKFKSPKIQAVGEV